MGRYGVITPDFMGRLLEACGKQGRRWARLLVYLTDKTTTGERLDSVEARWLSDWMEERGVPSGTTAIVVQLSSDQVARDVFGGHKQSAVSAVGSLVADGLIEVVHKGIKGHGTLYLLGFSEVTKASENVTVSEPYKGHEDCGLGHDFCGLGHGLSSATWENEVAFISNSVINSESEARVGEEKETGVRCPQCGSTMEPGSGYLVGKYCCTNRRCDTVVGRAKGRGDDGKDGKPLRATDSAA